MSDVTNILAITGQSDTNCGMYFANMYLFKTCWKSCFASKCVA